MNHIKQKQQTKCLTCGKVFDEFGYKNVLWSADKLQCCPVCETTVYEGKFKTIKKKG